MVIEIESFCLTALVTMDGCDAGTGWWVIGN